MKLHWVLPCEGLPLKRLLAPDQGTARRRVSTKSQEFVALS
jgi:hypothetical protein